MSKAWEQMKSCMERLLAFYEVGPAHSWMCRWHPDLDETPAQAIRDGRYDEVDAILNQLETGAYI